MSQSTNVKTYQENLEKLIIDNIDKARSSIYIVMAWFSSTPIKEALIKAKTKHSSLTIAIVVDENDINKKYFYNSAEKFNACGITTYKKIDDRFLHRKFMVIDEHITLVGSYNYSNNARYNLENITLIKDELIGAVHIRNFKRLTNPGYRDENIRLLFEHPEFAQQILSTYYPFSKQEYALYKDKILLGDCFTYDNGYYDEISFIAGFMFNPKWKFDKKLRDHEFALPISKDFIKEWIGSRNDNRTIDSYRDYVHLYHEINNELENNQKGLDVLFEGIIDTTYTYNVLKEKILKGLDLIVEDRLWSDNFGLFIDETIVRELFDGFPVVEKSYHWLEFEDWYKKRPKSKKW